MNFLRTSKALVEAALTLNSELILKFSNFDGARTARLDAPLDEPIVLDEAIGDELLVLCLHLGVEQLQHDLVAHEVVAFEARTLDTVDGRVACDVCLKILLETVLAERVVAAHFVQILREKSYQTLSCL